MRCGIYVRVSTDEQRDNGYSIDSQLRMIKEYCEKNNYDIVDVYNDAGHSGKDLMRPEMQRLLKDIKAHKIEKMALEKVRPSKAPYSYIRNAETGNLEIEPIEAQVVKEIFESYKNDNSISSIANTLKEEKTYLKQGKWNSDKVYKILTNSIYIGTFAYGKTKRKAQDILYVNNYCEPIIDDNTWNITRKILEKNKHPN